MKDNVHAKFLELIKRGAFGTIAEAECTLSFKTFVPVGVVQSSEAVTEFSEKLCDIILKGSHPTLNPIMDSLKEYETNSLQEAIKCFIDDNKEIETEKCDTQNDVMTLRVKANILTINCLPFFDQEEINIEKASVQTALFRYDLEE